MTSAIPPDFLADPFVAALPENLPFWQAAEAGRLLGKRCTDCGRHHWYPRGICPFCGSANTAWVPLSGRGSIHAFSTLRRASPPCFPWPTAAPPCSRACRMPMPQAASCC